MSSTTRPMWRVFCCAEICAVAGARIAVQEPTLEGGDGRGGGVVVAGEEIARGNAKGALKKTSGRSISRERPVCAPLRLSFPSAWRMPNSATLKIKHFARSGFLVCVVLPHCSESFTGKNYRARI